MKLEYELRILEIFIVKDTIRGRTEVTPLVEPFLHFSEPISPLTGVEAREHMSLDKRALLCLRIFLCTSLLYAHACPLSIYSCVCEFVCALQDGRACVCMRAC